MSAAAEASPAPAKSKKTLILIVAGVVLLAALGAGAFVFLKKKPADEDADEAAPAHPAKTTKVATHEPGAPPVFVPLDMFTVNLADREAERYAQVGITLEISDPKVGDQIKALMPAIRNNILMAIADKTAPQLIEREGKIRLAAEVRRETSRTLGYEVEDEDDEAAGEPAAPKKGKKKKAKRAAHELPIRAVHFSNFIIQ